MKIISRKFATLRFYKMRFWINFTNSKILCVHNRVSQKKICDSGQLMVEVIIKWIYVYYFRFRQLLERAMLKNQNQKMHCAHAQIFSTERSQQGMPLKLFLKNFADFRKFYYTTFLVNLHHFSYFDPTKKSANFFFYNFQRHSLLTALRGKNLRMRRMHFLVLVFKHCSLK